MPQPYDVLQIMGEKLTKHVIAQVWQHVRSREPLDLKVHSPDNEEAVQPLVFHVNNALCDIDMKWLLVGRSNGGWLVRYVLWQAGDRVFIQQLHV